MRREVIIPILLMSVASFMWQPVAAQSRRKVTPVETDEKKPEKPRLHYYDEHGNPLKEPVEFLTELDTVQKPSAGPKYPLLYSASVGVNFFDAVMLAAGQKYAGFDLWANLSLHNWFFPTVEVGVGFADNKPETGNFHYKGKPSVYAKVGLDYNFLYKSNPDYRVFLGVRAGFSSFSYDITDITINSDYWGQSNRFSLTGEKSTAFYGEVLAGVQVRIVKNFSLGWSIRYHTKFHVTKGGNSTPWYIPGYGATAPISFSFSAVYTLPFGHKEEAQATDADSK